MSGDVVAFAAERIFAGTPLFVFSFLNPLSGRPFSL
jgi:hypothetical protein